MCDVWNQDKWIAATNAGSKRFYTLEKTRYSAGGQRAIQVRGTLGSKYLTNVYSDDGYDYASFLRPRDANIAMRERGFTFTENPIPQFEQPTLPDFEDTEDKDDPFLAGLDGTMDPSSPDFDEDVYEDAVIKAFMGGDELDGVPV